MEDLRWCSSVYCMCSNLQSVMLSSRSLSVVSVTSLQHRMFIRFVGSGFSLIVAYELTQFTDRLKLDLLSNVKHIDEESLFLCQAQPVLKVQGRHAMLLVHVQSRPKDGHYSDQCAQNEFHGNGGNDRFVSVLECDKKKCKSMIDCATQGSRRR